MVSLTRFSQDMSSVLNQLEGRDGSIGVAGQKKNTAVKDERHKTHELVSLHLLQTQWL